MATDPFLIDGDPTAEQLNEALRSFMWSSHTKKVTPKWRRTLLDTLITIKDSVKPFRLLDLPAELRNRIYEFVLVNNNSHHIPSTCKHWTECNTLQPPLTKVNRQIRDESLTIFYGSNRFELHVHRCDFKFFFEWLQYIGRHNRERLRHIQVTLFDRWGCAEGLMDFVRSYARTAGIKKLQLHPNVDRWNTTYLRYRNEKDVERDFQPMSSTIEMFEGAIEVAKSLREGKGPLDKGKLKVTEGRTRFAWQSWLRKHDEYLCNGMDCGFPAEGYEEEPKSFDGWCTTQDQRVRYDDVVPCSKEKWARQLELEDQEQHSEYDSEAFGCEACGCQCFGEM